VKRKEWMLWLIIAAWRYKRRSVEQHYVAHCLEANRRAYSSAANWEKIDHIDFEFGRQSALNFATVHWIARVTSLIQAKRRQSR
jgi:hypothetical protein